MILDQKYFKIFQNRKLTKKAKKKSAHHHAVHSSKVTQLKQRSLKKTSHHKTTGSPSGTKKRTRELTDEQIDRSYTGLDRAIADGFIGSMMEPAMSSSKAVSNYRR